MLTQLELFAGLRGFALAASWHGIETVASVEIDEFCNKIGKKHFPNTKIYKDIYEFDGKKYGRRNEEFAGRSIDIVSGGFP